MVLAKDAVAAAYSPKPNADAFFNQVTLAWKSVMVPSPLSLHPTCLLRFLHTPDWQNGRASARPLRLRYKYKGRTNNPTATKYNLAQPDLGQ